MKLNPASFLKSVEEFREGLNACIDGKQKK